MKLEKILDNLNSFEKNSFLKVITGLRANLRDTKMIDKVMNSTSPDLKIFDSVQIAEVFRLLENEYTEYIRNEFVKASSQLDIAIDLIAEDGKCIMKPEWFSKWYNLSVKSILAKVSEFSAEFANEKTEITAERLRDYKIYTNCLKTAYLNDGKNNQDLKITCDEQSILDVLADNLELSQNEKILIKYSIIPVAKKNIDDAINDLKEKGIIFYSKKNNTLYIADEVVRVLRKIRGKEVANKFYRRVLRHLKEPQLNMIIRKHNIEKGLSYEQKIDQIIAKGISFSGMLKEDIFKVDVKMLEKRKVISELCDKQLQITPPIKGATLEDKVNNLILYFEEIENDEKVGISYGGYAKLLIDMENSIKDINQQIRKSFDLQEENVLNHEYLLDYNLKPRDILELLSNLQLEQFAKDYSIKPKGDIVSNILDSYRNGEDLYIENYVHIGARDLFKLKESGIHLKEADLGIKFETITRLIFTQLGFNVDEPLRKSINTAKDKIDIILNLGNRDIIIVECKSIKESGYNKFSSISRQLKAYKNLIERHKDGYKVAKLLVVSSDFTDDFVVDCREDCELNISLITASSLLKIWEGFRKIGLTKFPHNLFMKDVLIQEEVILKALGKR